MANNSGSTHTEGSAGAAGPSSETVTGAPQTPDSGEPENAPGSADGLAEKQQMIEKLFRHTNQFLTENKHDPLLVIEALAAILVRYAALLGPVEQMNDRLSVLERLIGQESAQIQEIAKSASQPKCQPK